MPRLRLVFAFVLAGCWGLVRAQGTTRAILPKALPEFRYSFWGQYPPKPSSTAGHHLHDLFVAFYNGSDREVASVDLRLRIVRDGRVVLLREPIHIDRFSDRYFNNPNGVVPAVRSFGMNPIQVDLADDDWLPNSQVSFDIVGLRIYEGKQDLHDLGHLYTWLRKTPDPQVVAALKADPTLASASNSSGYTGLAIAIMAGSVMAIEAMSVPQHFGVPTFPYGLTRVSLAAYNPRPEALEYELTHGGDANAKANRNQTPLMVALFMGRLDNVRVLLRHGADPSAVDADGLSTLKLAIEDSPSEAAILLIEAGARLDLRDGRGYGPMQEAAAADLIVLELLQKRGVSVDDADPRFGVTPLMAAAAARRHDTAHWLVEHGAKLDLKDAKGRDAFDYAREASPTHSDEEFRKWVAETKASRG